MIEFEVFKATFDNNLSIPVFNSQPYVKDDKFSFLETLYKALEEVDKIITRANTMEEAIERFEEYVLSQLVDYNEKIIQEIRAQLQIFINDGTIANLINSTIFGQINSDISTLKTDVATNKQAIIDLNYKLPQLSLSSQPSTYIYSKGDTINSVVLNYEVTKGTNNIIKAEIYKNNSLLQTITNVNNGANSYTDTQPISENTSYFIKLYDDKNNIESVKINYNFFYKIYYGVLKENDIVNATYILNLNSTIFDKDFSYISSLNDEKIIFVTNDEITSVIDTENYDIIDSFDKTIVPLNINNIQTNFNVYISRNFILDNNVKILIEK